MRIMDKSHKIGCLIILAAIFLIDTFVAWVLYEVFTHLWRVLD